MSIPAIITVATLKTVETDFLELFFFLIDAGLPLCHYADCGIWKLLFHPHSQYFCAPLANRCPENAEPSSVHTAKILWKVETGEKMIKVANQCPFLPMVKHSQDLRAHMIKRITTMKTATTKGNILACTKPK